MLRKVKIIPDVTEYKPKYKVFVDSPIRIFGLNPGHYVCSKEEALKYNMLHIIYDSSGDSSSAARVVSKSISIRSLLKQNTFGCVLVFYGEAMEYNKSVLGIGFSNTDGRLMVGRYINTFTKNQMGMVDLTADAWLYYLALSD